MPTLSTRVQKNATCNQSILEKANRGLTAEGRGKCFPESNWLNDDIGSFLSLCRKLGNTQNTEKNPRFNQYDNSTPSINHHNLTFPPRISADMPQPRYCSVVSLPFVLVGFCLLYVYFYDTSGRLLSPEFYKRLIQAHLSVQRGQLFKETVGQERNAALSGPKNRFLIYTRYRSGSSFVGELLNNHPDVYYMFEPLKLLSLQEQVSVAIMFAIVWFI